MERIKDEIKKFLNVYMNTEPVKTRNTYRRVKGWVVKCLILYLFFMVGAIILTPVVAPVMSNAPSILVMIVLVWMGWGFSSMLLNLKFIFKSSLQASKKGFEAGSKIETQHINVTYEYGNTYRVNTYTENQGCVTAIFSGFFKLFFWLFGCVYIAPFLVFIKITKSINNLRNYRHVN